MTFVWKAIRLLFALIDGVLGWAIGEVYEIIVKLGNVDVFGNYIYEFMGRIYTFLAIFMVFKLSISMVNYILNPDQFTDKSKGFGKIIQNVIIVIALIMFVPTIFSWAYKLQSLILNTNVLYTVVTGSRNDSTYDVDYFLDMSGNEDKEKEYVEWLEDQADDSGNMIKYHLLRGFIYYKDNAVAMKKGKTSCEVKYTNGDVDYAKSFDCLLSSETYNDTSQKNFGSFTNEYRFLVSTACLGFALYIFLGICLDVALRTVKLGFLQLIAPVPIISRLDPDSAKNGMFSKWLKESTTTYTSLFIKLFSVYFAIEIITAITEPGRFVWRDTTQSVDLMMQILLILGCLMFAKQLPQIIDSSLGFKMGADGFNLKKKLGGVPGLNRTAAGAIGLGGGLAANAIAGVRGFDKKHPFKSTANALFSPLGGGLSGAFRGMSSKEKNAWKAGQGAIKGSVNARNLRDQRQTTGYTLGRRIGAGIDTFAGLDPTAKFENEIKQYDDFGKQAGAILSHVESEMIKYGDLALSNGFTMSEHKKEKEMLTALENRDTSTMTASELDAHTEQLSKLRDRVNINNKKFAKAYVGAVMTGATLHKSDGSAVVMNQEDVQTEAMVSGLEHTASTSSNEMIKNLSLKDSAGNFDIKAANDSVSNKKAEVANSADYQRALANKKAK